MTYTGARAAASVLEPRRRVAACSRGRSFTGRLLAWIVLALAGSGAAFAGTSQSPTGAMVDATRIIERGMGGRNRVADILDAWRRSPHAAMTAEGRCGAFSEPGMSETFNIFDLTNFDDLGGIDVECTQVRLTDHAYIYVQTDLWGGSLINDAVIDSFVTLFEVSTPAVADPPYVYPSIDPAIGVLDILDTYLWPFPDSTEPEDADGRDPIFIVFVDIPDSYRRPGDLAVNGYFSSVNELCADEFNRNYRSYIAKGLRSNEREMLVLDIDPSLGPGFRDIVRGVPAHELQHLLHWFADDRESTWLDEGYADLAAAMVGFPAVGHYNAFLDDHDKTSLARWDQLQEDYGHSGLFARYLADHSAFGAANRWGNMETIRAIMASQDTSWIGVSSGLAEQGDPRSMTDLYLDFSVAMVLQEPSFADGRYGMPPGGPDLQPKHGKFIDSELTGISSGGGEASLSDQVASLTGRYTRLESFAADSVYLRLTGPSALVGKAVLGFDGTTDDPVDLIPVEVLDFERVAASGSDDVSELLLRDVGRRGDRVLVVTTWLDPLHPGADPDNPDTGIAHYALDLSGDASGLGDCLSLLRVAPNPVKPGIAGYNWPLRFFGDAPGPPCAQVMLFDAAGKLVRDWNEPPFEWFGDGDDVASGLYHWVARGDGEIRRGSVAVIR